jgi:hypothetical protein
MSFHGGLRVLVHSKARVLEGILIRKRAMLAWWSLFGWKVLPTLASLFFPRSELENHPRWYRMGH